MSAKETGERIRCLREGNGKTQEELADIVGVSRQSVFRWENGDNFPGFDKLIVLSKYFKVDIDFLMPDRKELIEAQKAFEAAAAMSECAADAPAAKPKPEPEPEPENKTAAASKTAKSPAKSGKASRRKRNMIIFAVIAGIVFAVGMVFAIITGCVAFDTNMGDDSVGIHSIGIIEFILSLILMIVGFMAETAVVVLMFRAKITKAKK